MTKSASTERIRRPMNSFMIYRLEKQQEIVDRCPGANHRDISKIVANWWSELPVCEKEPYRLKAEKEKADHLQRYPNYKYKPKKKVAKTRPYKKRPENEFTTLDSNNKHQLFSMYHNGNISGFSSQESVKDDKFILDPKPAKKTKRRLVKTITKELPVTRESSPSALSYREPRDTSSNPDIGTESKNPLETNKNTSDPPSNKLPQCAFTVPSHSLPPILPRSRDASNYPLQSTINEYAPYTKPALPLPYYYAFSNQYYMYGAPRFYANYHPLNHHGSYVAANNRKYDIGPPLLGYFLPVNHFI